MLIAEIVGHAVATIKHPSLTGWRLLVVQPLTADEKPDGEPLLAIDPLGAGAAQRVMISNDGRGTREMVKDENSPARWMVIGICDQ